MILVLPITKFRILLQNAQNYLSCCLYSKKSLLLSNVKLLNRCIENAVKYISLLNAANDFKSSSEKLSITTFYNYLIDLENLIRDYKIWENPYLNEFTFCQYPCVLSILAKKQILQKESEEQMMITAKNNLFIKVQQRQIPEFEMLFLNLSIRRCNILSDSMNQILIKRKELKKKLKVEFIGEPGLDMGGLTKEWFLLLLRQIMKAEKSVFSYDAKSQCNWFHSIPPGNKHREFYLTGILMGLAVYNSVNLDVEFPLFCYKKLLSRKVYTPRNKQAGYCLATLDDLATIYPDLARGLKELILYEGDIENDFFVTFEIFYEDWNGKICNHLLKENGSNIYVTLENRAEYVELYCDFLLNSLIATEFLDFYNGFHTVCDSNILMLLQPEEIKSLVCGNPIINLSGLKNVVVYDNYKATDKTIVIFWEILSDFNESRQKLFLHFTTGSSKVPIGGIQELQFKISKSNNKNMLPMAYTCFNQLILPEYNDKNILKQKLLIAIENSEGFGLT